MAGAHRDNAGCVSHRGVAGMDYPTVQTANCARRRTLLQLAALVSARNRAEFGVCRISGGVVMAWLAALVDQSFSAGPADTATGFNLVRATKPFRVDVQSARQRRLREGERSRFCQRRRHSDGR